MNLRKLIKQTLNEVAGISFEVREWAQILSDEIDRLVKEADDNEGGKETQEEPTNHTSPFDDEDYYGEEDYDYPEMNNNRWWSSGNMGGNFNSWKPTPRADIQELTIDGKDFPEAYKKFSVDKWIFRQASRIEYSHNESGYNDKGEYEVIFNVPIRGLSMGMFVHETKHAYDDWNRIRHGGTPIKDSWEIKNIYTADFEKLILGDGMKFPRLGGVIRMYYLGSKLETPAYLENEFDNPTAQAYRNTGKKLMNFKKSIFFNKRGKPVRGLEDEFVDILINYNIPFFRKFKDVGDFLTYTEKYFNKRGTDIVKRIDKMLYIHDKTPQQRMRQTQQTQPNHGPNKT